MGLIRNNEDFITFAKKNIKTVVSIENNAFDSVNVLDGSLEGNKGSEVLNVSI